ncbi:GtrA family protein [Roseomonas sp. NAR14]|uniref:GtrA family protein n=1 Tax=Roseomonas acroporae TaxID=2937791 RepID=A0A9X2BV19_9PROT|nr:GtrA family protein [Roseomonas acroporae]MCK8786192.1 GtrA family protein [Roseomonas acroporae]
MPGESVAGAGIAPAGAAARADARPAGLSLALRYALFAAICTVINLLVQMAAHAVYDGPFSLVAAMTAGTLAGIVPKYLLDKRWIFFDQSGGLDTHARKFTLYTLLSVVTTLLFWATEFLFDWLAGGNWRYLGAVLGLALGYWVKYHLDRKLVFDGA